jgi:TPR repeat protein
MAPPRYAVTCCGLAAFALMLALAANTCFAQPSPTSAADAALRMGAFDRAANLLEQQAKAGDAEAQYKLASLYRLGRGVPQDEAAAFRWMKSAAERGHAEAQLNLAKMYLAGRGVATNVAEARAWLARAAANGRSEAAGLALEIAAQMSREPPKQGSAWSATVDPQATGPATAPEPAAGSALAAAGRPARKDVAAARNGLPAVLDAAWRGQAQALGQLIAAGAALNVTDEDVNAPWRSPPPLRIRGAWNSCSRPAPTPTPPIGPAKPP